MPEMIAVHCFRGGAAKDVPDIVKTEYFRALKEKARKFLAFENWRFAYDHNGGGRL